MFSKPSIKIVKFMVPGTGVQALRRGHFGQMVKLYFVCIITVMEDKIMHCYYVHNVLMLNFEIHYPDHVAEVKAFYIHTPPSPPVADCWNARRRRTIAAMICTNYADKAVYGRIIQILQYGGLYYSDLSYYIEIHYNCK